MWEWFFNREEGLIAEAIGRLCTNIQCDIFNINYTLKGSFQGLPNRVGGLLNRVFNS